MKRRNLWGCCLLLGVLCLYPEKRGIAGPAGRTSKEEDPRRFLNEVTVEGIPLKGRTFSEAKAAILKKYDWEMEVSLGKHTAELPNLMESRTEALLLQIFSGEYRLDTGENRREVWEAAEKIGRKFSFLPEEPTLYAFDKETERFLFQKGKTGREIDEKELAEEIFKAIEQREFQKNIQIKGKKIQPENTVKELKEQYQIIGEFTTDVHDDGNRNHNIALASEALNGWILLPGEEFSFNEATGSRSLEKGYLPAAAYLNGETVQEPGGGVCQVSSTLYNAVIVSGLKTTERWAHTYEPSYVAPGADATVSYGGPDFKFLNNSKYPVGIRVEFSEGKLSASLYGVPVLKEGESVFMESVRDGGSGNVWITYLVRSLNGEETERKKLHTSYYS